MNNQNVVVHRLVSGENLYRLAQKYNTTVDAVLASNPYLNPYRLRIGDEIVVYPGRYEAKGHPMTTSEVDLMNNMRALWEQHVIWTRLFIISVVDNLKDLDFVTKRLLKNPVDIGNLFRVYYGEAIAKKITDLLTEHLAIAGDLVKALKKGDNVKATALDKRWYKNADDMAFAFASINPHYVEKEVKEMLYKHLDLTKREAADRLAGNYAADIEDFDNIEKQALMMADYFSKGIVNQFPNKFTQ